MAQLYNLARMTTFTVGTGTISLQAAASGYLSFAAAGIVNGDTVSYGIIDGTSSEVGRGVYTSAGTTLTRSVLLSTNSNNAISLSGSAEVFICGLAEDFSRRLISETVTTGSASEVNITSIPQGYRDLELRVRARSTFAGTEDTLRIQFNGDTGANYDQQIIFGDNAGSAADTMATGQTTMSIGQLPASTATANFAGASRVDIMDYKTTARFKEVLMHIGQSYTLQRTQVGAGQWQSATAITSARVFWASGNFENSSVVSLYGLL